jgi:hypothetical protein
VGKRNKVTASVLVECKNNSQSFAFFGHRQQRPERDDNRIPSGGFPSLNMDQETKIQVPLHKLLEMKDWHHDCQLKDVATQFCTFERNGKKFKAGPNENYSKSFSKLAAVTASDSAGGYGLQLQCLQVHASYRLRSSKAQSIACRMTAGRRRWRRWTISNCTTQQRSTATMPGGSTAHSTRNGSRSSAPG